MSFHRRVKSYQKAKKCKISMKKGLFVLFCFVFLPIRLTKITKSVF